jgi:hypothetical protein
MSTVDVNRVILIGENSVIRINSNDSDVFTTNATFWRILSSAGGPGHVLYLKSELTETRWRIYSDNIAMARWLQSTVLGVINAELLDLTIPVADAQFGKSGDARDFWTERLETEDEQIVLTWYELGEPLLVHTQPNTTPGRPYGMCTVLIPALAARLTRNGNEAQGRPWPRDRVPGRRSSPQQTTDFHRTMAKVCKSGGEGTFAERHGNGEVAPIPAVRMTTRLRPGGP